MLTVTQLSKDVEEGDLSVTAVAELKAKAEKGNAIAQSMLGFMYGKGQG